MKKYIHISLISVLLLGLSATPAHAGDDEAFAAIGGFVAGMITGVIINDHDDRVHVSVHDKYGSRHDRHYRGKPHRSGHWEIKRVRVWVPGYWDVRYNPCGDRVKVWRRGHYELRKERVWVAYDNRGRHDRYDRDRSCRG